MYQHKMLALLLAVSAALTGCDSTQTSALSPSDLSPAGLVASNTWETKAPLASGRWGMAAVTVGAVTYVIGGARSDGLITTTVQSYNVAANAWSTSLTPLPSPRVNMNGATNINGKIYVAGGDVTSSFDVSKTLLVYDPAADTWTQKANMPLKSDCGIQGTINGFLYVYAHCLSGDTQVFMRYNPTTNAWTTLAAPPTRHIYPEGGVINGRFYVTGGLDDNANFNLKTHAYNPATNTWTNKASMPAPQGHAMSKVLNEKLYIAGGFNSTGDAVAALRVYNPGTNTWTTKHSMPTPRLLGVGAAAGGKFVVIGGKLDNGSITRKVEAYTP